MYIYIYTHRPPTLETAISLDPLEHQAAHVDAKGGRGVEQRLVLGHQRIVEHGGGDGLGMAKHIPRKGEGRWRV